MAQCYPSEPILDVLTLNGAPGAYNKTLGSGIGINWIPADSGLRVSLSTVATNGQLSDIEKGGLASANAGSTSTVQLGWDDDSWRVAATYSLLQNGHELIAYATPYSQSRFSETGLTHAIGLGGSWQPTDSGWIPSFSVGWGINSSDNAGKGEIVQSQSWTVGLEWADVLLDGNRLGLAVGQPVFATTLRGATPEADGPFIWEAWYQWQLTDSISITPAVFGLSRPLGGDTPSGKTLQQLGGLVKTTIRF